MKTLKSYSAQFQLTLLSKRDLRVFVTMKAYKDYFLFVLKRKKTDEKNNRLLGVPVKSYLKNICEA